MEEWRSGRSPGLRGIEEFSSRLAHLPKIFLTTHWIEAKTASHKFVIAASLLIQARQGQVPIRNSSRALATYPALGDIITAVLDTDEDEDSGGDILLEGEGDLRQHVEDLAADALVEKEKETGTEATAEEACFRGSFQAGTGGNSLMQNIKKRLTVQRHAIAAL